MGKILFVLTISPIKGLIGRNKCTNSSLF